MHRRSFSPCTSFPRGNRVGPAFPRSCKLRLAPGSSTQCRLTVYGGSKEGPTFSRGSIGYLTVPRGSRVGLSFPRRCILCPTLPKSRRPCASVAEGGRVCSTFAMGSKVGALRQVVGGDGIRLNVYGSSTRFVVVIERMVWRMHFPVKELFRALMMVRKV